MFYKPIIRYLTADLDLVSAAPLDDFATSLESQGVSPLGEASYGADGFWYWTFETDNSHDEPDSNIAELLSVIEALRGDLRQAWDDCVKREFNIGYDCGDEPWAFNQGLSNDTLRRMADCGATFRVTLYPFRADESS